MLIHLNMIIVSEEIGEKPLSFDPERFFKHAVGITSSEEDPVKVILKTDKVSARYINSQPFHTSQNIIKEGKNKTSFKLNVLISEEFIRSILSYGGGIEVIEPMELRDEITIRLEEMAENYKI